MGPGASAARSGPDRGPAGGLETGIRSGRPEYPLGRALAQLRHAAEMVRPRVLYPYHYGDTDPNAIIEALEGLDIDVRIRNFQ